MSTIGLNLSGGEFGGSAGTYGYDYRYPTLTELQFYNSHGVDLIRLPFKWERVQEALGGALDLKGDLALIKQVLVNAASLGMEVILDNHNYGRYGGIAIGADGGPSAAQFADFWQKMAVELKDYSALVGYDLMNEPHGMPTSTIWKEAAQAATDAIRQVDLDNTIYVEGTGWSTAGSWLKYNSDLIINDPANKIVYEAHQYFDKSNSGTYANSYDADGTYPMIGVDRITAFVGWLEANNLKGMIGEFGVPSNDPRWFEVQKNVLDYMQAHNVDGTAWGGGTWWSTSYSMYTAKPGQLDSGYMDLLEKYFNPYTDVFGSPAPSGISLVAPSVWINNPTGSEAQGALVFTITRSGDLSGASSVNYATADGTALTGSDYTSAAGTVQFAPGQASATVTIQLTNDTLVEGSESFNVKLSGGANVAIIGAVGTGTITNDDVAFTNTITGTNASETLWGTSSDDIIYGLGGNDVIKGGGGADKLTGGAGSDRFVFGSAGDANHDLITDFAFGDILDLRPMDANSNRSGNQSFTWLGTGDFSGKAGQLHEFNQDGHHYVAGDTNGDYIADFVIEVAGTTHLMPTDFFL